MCSKWDKFQAGKQHEQRPKAGVCLAYYGKSKASPATLPVLPVRGEGVREKQRGVRLRVALRATVNALPFAPR